MRIEYPSVAVVITCRNEQDYIKACVLSVLEQKYQGDLKVIVVDGFSDDGTREILSQMMEKSPALTMVDNPQRTTPQALNIGIKYGNADISIILGGHAKLLPGYIERCVFHMLDNPSLGCVGGIIDSVHENDTARIISLAMSSSFGVGNAHFRTGNKSGYVDTVAFGAYSRNVFEQIGYFDEDLTRNQDDEFNFRLLKNGFKIWLDPDIRSLYFVRASYSKLFRQYFQYGYWKVFVNTKHKTITTVRQLFPALLLLLFFPGVLIALLHPVLCYMWLSAIVLYFLLGIVFAAKSAGRAKDSLNVFRSFVILHTSYGAGYLKGIWDFILLKKKSGKSYSKLTR